MPSCEYCRGYVVRVFNDHSKAFCCCWCGERLESVECKPIWHRRKWIMYQGGLCVGPNWFPSKKEWDDHYDYLDDKSDEWEELKL